MRRLNSRRAVVWNLGGSDEEVLIAQRRHGPPRIAFHVEVTKRSSGGLGRCSGGGFKRGAWVVMRSFGPAPCRVPCRAWHRDEEVSAQRMGRS